jgi:hypothetical protein
MDDGRTTAALGMGPLFAALLSFGQSLRCVSSLNNLTMVRQAIQQRRRHFCVMEHLRPFSKCQIRRYYH